MIARLIGSVVVGGILVVGAPGVQAESKGCAEIVAASEESDGALSAEELAKKLNTDIETVRNCLDKKAAPPPKPAGGTPPQPPRY
jgi:hypothetical protein